MSIYYSKIFLKGTDYRVSRSPEDEIFYRFEGYELVSTLPPIIPAELSTDTDLLVAPLIPGPSDTATAINLRISAAIDALILGAPGALDTLNELAAALGDDPNFAATVSATIALKANAIDMYDKTASDARFAPIGASSTYVATLGVSNGTADAATINAAITAANAAGGGVVKGHPGQVYVADAQVTLESNVTLDLSGCHLTRKTTGYYLISNAAAAPLRTTADATVIGTTLSALLSTAGPITALPVAALPAALPAGALVTIAANLTGTAVFQTWTLTAPASAGATSLAVAPQAPAFAFTGTTPVVSNILTSATANFTSADVGRAATIAGAGYQGAYELGDLYATITTVTNATTVILSVAGVTAVSAAGLSVYGRDQNITLIGDASTVLDDGIGSGLPSYYSTHFRRIDNFRMLGHGAQTRATTGGGHVMFSVGDLTDFLFDDWVFGGTVPAGGLQPCGPMDRFTISNVRGTVGDDFVALQGSGYGWNGGAVNDVQGDITNGHLFNLFPNSLGVGMAVKIFGGYTNAGIVTHVMAITVENVKGTVGSTQAGVDIHDDRGGPTWADQIIFRDISVATPNLAADGSMVYLSASQMQTVRVENPAVLKGGTISAQAELVVCARASGSSSLTVTGVSVPVTASYLDIVRIPNSPGSDVNNLTVRDVYVAGSGTGINVVANQGTLRSLTVDGVNGELPSGAYVVKSTSCLLNLNARNINATSAAFSLGTNGTYPMSMTWSDSVQGTSATAITAACPLLLMLSNVAVNNAALVSYGGAGALRILSGHSVRWPVITTDAITGTGNWSVNGHIPADPATLTPTDGDTCWNTNAAYGSGVGPVVWRASAVQWRSLYSPSLPLSPDNFPGLVAWYKADAIVGLTSGQAVSSWVDSSASGVPIVQAIGANQPIYTTAVQNGLPAVVFDGTDDVLAAASGVAVGHVFVVAKYSAATFAGWNGLIAGSSGVANNAILSGNGSGTTVFGSYAANGDTAAYYYDGTPYVESAMAAPMNIFGVAELSVSAGLAATLTLMVGQDRGLASRYWNGPICEVIVFNAPLSVGAGQCVEAYLKAKWATP